MNCCLNGEFLFITASRKIGSGDEVELISFWGLGYHEYRDRWYSNEWHFHRANQFASTLAKREKAAEVKKMIALRLDDISPHLGQEQSRQGQIFEMLADVGCDDSTLSLLEDFGGEFQEFSDE